MLYLKRKENGSGRLNTTIHSLGVLMCSQSCVKLMLMQVMTTVTKGHPLEKLLQGCHNLSRTVRRRHQQHSRCLMRLTCLWIRLQKQQLQKGHADIDLSKTSTTTQKSWSCTLLLVFFLWKSQQVSRKQERKNAGDMP